VIRMTETVFAWNSVEVWKVPCLNRGSFINVNFTVAQKDPQIFV
jgi:hypothetical protein